MLQVLAEIDDLKTDQDVSTVKNLRAEVNSLATTNTPFTGFFIFVGYILRLVERSMGISAVQVRQESFLGLSKSVELQLLDLYKAPSSDAKVN